MNADLIKAPVHETAVLAGGCFWGMEEIIRKIPGILKTTVGYSGGTTPDPTYEDVCTGMTGHAESIQVEFDSTRLTYESLLDYFFRMHDPTTLNRRHFLHYRGPKEDCGSSEGEVEQVRQVQPPHHDGDNCRREILSSRGVPPKISGETSGWLYLPRIARYVEGDVAPRQMEFALVLPDKAMSLTSDSQNWTGF